MLLVAAGSATLLLIASLLLLSPHIRTGLVALVNAVVASVTYKGFGPTAIVIAIAMGRSPGRFARQLHADRIVLLAFGVVLVQAVSAIWSVEPDIALAAALRTSTFALAAIFVMGIADSPARTVIALCRGTLLVALVQALSTVVFLVRPDVERAYYDSRIASFLLTSAASQVFVEGSAAYNNVADPERAGGVLFLNVNRAALTMGAWMLLFIIGWIVSKSRVFAAMAVLLAVAVALTGSKTGLTLLILLPAVALTLWRFLKARSATAGIFVVLCFVAACVAGAVLVSLLGTEFVDASATTLAPRTRLWNQAAAEIFAHPILGIGFGGWEAHWLVAGATDLGHLRFPPHNFFLYDWLNSGIVAAALDVAVGVAVCVSMTRMAARAQGVWALVHCFVLAAFLWSFIHGMGDNTELFGTQFSLVTLGFLRGVSTVANRNQPLEGRVDSNRVADVVSPRSGPGELNRRGTLRPILVGSRDAHARPVGSL